MPGMSGGDLVLRVREAGYFFPIVLISGYGEAPPDVGEEVEFMRKPLDLEALAARAAGLLQSSLHPV